MIHNAAEICPKWQRAELGPTRIIVGFSSGGGAGPRVGLWFGGVRSEVRILSPRPPLPADLRATCMAAKAKHIIVHGRVQGVNFRYFVQRVGSRLGLTGNVWNCPDSTVEIVVEGSAGRIEEFLREVEQGPPLARVERLEIHDIPARGNYRSFLIEGWL